jgi:cellulose synthase operon protein B
MKKIFRNIFSIAILTLLMSGLVFNIGSAESAQLPQAAGQSTITFGLMGLSDTIMQGPYSTMRVVFGTPANWAFQTGSELQLILTSQLATDSSLTIADGSYIGGTMTVTLDKKVLTILPLVAGKDVPYNIPLLADALVSPYSDGHHELSLFMDSGVDCRYAFHRTTVIVSATSQFLLNYNEQAPSIDLTNLPRPIYQRNSVFPINADIVIPDAPSVQEMRAAMITMASFGRMSSGSLPVTLLPASQLTPELQTNSNLIFVGKASTLASLMQGINLSAPLTNNAFSVQGMQADDGILEMAVSPWNGGRSVLIVSGNTDAGVIKAAQALSNNNIQTGKVNSQAVIGDVTLADLSAYQLSPTLLPQDTFTFTDLGYTPVTLSGQGILDDFVAFSIPPGMVASGDTYLDLTFNNSPQLDFNSSGLTVFVNGHLIGGAVLSLKTTSTTTQRFAIPLSVLEPGNNQLKIEADLLPLTQCSSLNLANLWLSVLPESVLHLPLQPATVSQTPTQDLSIYPYPFANEPTLSNLAFVVAKNDPEAWSNTAQIAYWLGRQASGSIINFTVAYDSEISDQVRQNNDMIVVGLPINLKILTDLNKSLPASFDPNSNVAALKGQQVTYHFPADTDLGYLELMPSPWNPSYSILSVVGTTPGGVKLSSTALTDPAQSSQLRGNLAIIVNKTITAVDTRTGSGLSGVSSNTIVTTQVAPEQITPAPSLASGGGRNWIPVAIGVLVLLIIIVIIVAMILSRREKSGNEKKSD